MAVDFDSSLPVRSEADGTDQRVHVKIVGSPDGTTVPAANQAAVDDDKNVHVEMHGNDPAAADKVLRLSELGAVTPDGVYDVDDNSKPGNVGVIASTREATPGDTYQTERITSIKDGDSNVTALDVSLHDYDGKAFSDTNPLPVFVTETEGGTPIHHFVPSASVAAGSSVDHDYTVTALKTLSLRQIQASGSGKMRVELKVASDGITFASIAVLFNSTSDPNVELTLAHPIVLPAGAKVRLSLLNREVAAAQAQDLNSLIVGIEK